MGELFGYTYTEIAVIAIVAWIILSFLGGLMIHAMHHGQGSLLNDCFTAAGYVLLLVVGIAVALAAFAFSIIAGIIIVVIGFVVVLAIAGGGILDIF